MPCSILYSVTSINVHLVKTNLIPDKFALKHQYYAHYMNFCKWCNKVTVSCQPRNNTHLTCTHSITFSLWPAPPQAAWWTFILLYALSLCRGNLNTLPMEPPLTYVTANPKLISVVISAAASTKCFIMLIFILLITLIYKLWVAFNLLITRSLQINLQECFIPEGGSPNSCAPNNIQKQTSWYKQLIILLCF